MNQDYLILKVAEGFIKNRETLLPWYLFNRALRWRAYIPCSHPPGFFNRVTKFILLSVFQSIFLPYNINIKGSSITPAR